LSTYTELTKDRNLDSAWATNARRIDNSNIGASAFPVHLTDEQCAAIKVGDNPSLHCMARGARLCHADEMAMLVASGDFATACDRPADVERCALDPLTVPRPPPPPGQPPPPPLDCTFTAGDSNTCGRGCMYTAAGPPTRPAADPHVGACCADERIHISACARKSFVRVTDSVTVKYPPDEAELEQPDHTDNLDCRWLFYCEVPGKAMALVVHDMVRLQACKRFSARPHQFRS
jgi:hypothetical protein